MEFITLSDAEVTQRGGSPAIRVEILRTGEWLHPAAPGGVLRISEHDLDEIVRHFRNGTFGYELPVNLNHEDDSTDAAGWVTSLERQGESVYATIRPVQPEVMDRVRDGRLRYASAELVVGGVDPESRRAITALRAVALTNRPYIKRMQPAEVVCFSERAAAQIAGGRAMQNSSRIHELENQLQALMERQWESDRDLLLSEYESLVPPSVLNLARYIFDALHGRRVTLGELRAGIDSGVLVRLSENQPDTRVVPVEDMVLALLEEVASLIPNRPRVNLAEVEPRYTTRTNPNRATRELVARAEKCATEHGLPFGEALKRVTREEWR